VITRGKIVASASPSQLMAEHGGSLEDVILRLAKP